MVVRWDCRLSGSLRWFHLAASPTVAAAFFGDADDTLWTYADQASWTDLPNSECGAQGWQAPVDIQSAEAYDAASGDGFVGGYPLEEVEIGSWTTRRLGSVSWSNEFAFVNVSLLVADGTWRAHLQAPHDTRTKATYGEEEFFLKSFSFHSPSETWVDGEATDMEFQMLHMSLSGGHLVVSVSLQVGLVQDNEFMEQLWPHFLLLEPGGDPVYQYIWSPYVEALPTDRTFFAFNASLTTPPCTTSTIWIAFKEPILISRRQRDAFRQSLNSTSATFLHYGPSPGSEPSEMSDLPPGVTRPWDTTIGSNNRFIQRSSTHEVVLVKMQSSDAVPTEPPEVQRHAWVWVVAALLFAFLCCGSVIMVGMFLCLRRDHSSKPVKPKGSSKNLQLNGATYEDAESWRSLSHMTASSELSTLSGFQMRAPATENLAQSLSSSQAQENQVLLPFHGFGAAGLMTQPVPQLQAQHAQPLRQQANPFAQPFAGVTGSALRPAAGYHRVGR